MQGWQLDTFKESYEHKKNKGISLFKKNFQRIKTNNLFSSSPCRSSDILKLDWKV